MPETKELRQPPKFRLTPAEIKQLNEIAVWLTNRDGLPRNRTDALRFCLTEGAKKISRNPKK